MANLDLTYNNIDRQKAVIEYSNGFLVCIAGPGTGKTSALIKRIRYLNSVKEVNKSNICYLTFIKEITKAFSNDYFDEFSALPNLPDEIRVNTLHSFACKIIRNIGYTDGFDGSLNFISYSDKKDKNSEELIKDIFQIHNIPEIKTPAQLRSEIQRIKNCWQNNQDPLEIDQSLEPLLDILNRWFVTFRTLDWDFSVVEATKLINIYNIPDWVTRIHHFLIDEYQDFNVSEQRFLLDLIIRCQSTVVVGDDKQSIYLSRGGSPCGLNLLVSDQNFDQVTFVFSYRNPTTLLNHINLCAKRIAPASQDLQAKNSGGKIECYEFETRAAEISYLINYLNDAIANISETVSAKEGIVCLFPVKKVLDHYFEIISQKVPCSKKSVNYDVFRENLKIILSLINQPGMRFFERLLLTNTFKVKRRNLRPVLQRIYSENIEVRSAIDRTINETHVNDETKRLFQQFNIFLEQIYSDDSELISGALYNHFPLEKDFLKQKMDQFLDDNKDTREDYLEEFLDEIFPATVNSSNSVKSVSFLTIHGSKGLTRKTVILPSLDQSWLPGDCIEEKLAEKRRLFYVAISRATKNVLITYPTHFDYEDPLAYDRKNRGQRSVFVYEAGIPVYKMKR